MTTPDQISPRQTTHTWMLTCFSDIVLDKSLPGDKIKLSGDILEEIVRTPSRQIPDDPFQVTVPPLGEEDLSQDLSQDIKFPLIFKITYGNNAKSLVMSVLDFTGEPGHIYIPQWAMFNLYPLNLGEQITVELYSGGLPNTISYQTNIPDCILVKLRPHESTFLMIEDHKKILEQYLSNYGILNCMSTITFTHQDIQYNLDIIELMPENIVSITNVDISVDFEPPVDYQEVEIDDVAMSEPKAKVSEPMIESDTNQQSAGSSSDLLDTTQKFIPFSGKGYRLGNS